MTPPAPATGTTSCSGSIAMSLPVIGGRMLVKLSAEMRLLDNAVADHHGRVRIGPGAAKSERHQREPRRHTPEAHVLNTRNSQASGTAAVTI
jgi:hypothetical protein